MSEISVHRTAGGGRCLVIDGTRVAGAKPEFSGDNCVCWWETDKTIGVVDDLMAEVESWKAANKRLREHIDETCAGWAEAYEALEAENEKLRKLVRDMWRDIPKTESCGWDSSANTCTGIDECHGECALWHRMHELGIEVDE